MTAERSSNRGVVWAVVGGVVLLIGIGAVVVTAVLSQSAPAPGPTASRTSSPSSPAVSPPPALEPVDPTATEHGWIPEPVTTDAEEYVRVALAAASTFDTTLSTRDEWLAYLDTWFTPDTRYTSDTDRQARMQAARLELRQGVVLPQQEWDSLASRDGRVQAQASDDIAIGAVPEDESGDMAIGTADVTLTFTQSDGSSEAGYEDLVRVSVQVLCGPDSVPTPGTAQRAGDCKVVRFFTEPLEP